MDKLFNDFLLELKDAEKKKNTKGIETSNYEAPVIPEIPQEDDKVITYLRAQYGLKKI